MSSRGSASGYDRVLERLRAVALAQHFRDAEGLSIAQIAERLGRSPATIKAYFYDPTGGKARAVKARYQGVCRGCGAYTQPRNGKGDAYSYCKRCRPGAAEALDPRGCARCDAPLALSVRTVAVVVRLVSNARTPARGCATRASRRHELASGKRRKSAIRDVGGGPDGGIAGRRPAG
jgi:AraC-like DNA-binding protein